MTRYEKKHKSSVIHRSRPKNVTVERPASFSTRTHQSSHSHSCNRPPEPSAPLKEAYERMVEKYNSRNWLERLVDNF